MSPSGPPDQENHAPRRAIDTKIVLHYFSEMKNITISLPDELAHRAKVFAAEHNTSVSRFVGEMLSERLRQETRYQRAMKQWRLREVGPLSDGETAYPSRDSLHER